MNTNTTNAELTSTKKTLKQMSVLELIERIVELSARKEKIEEGRAKRYIREMASRLDLTPMQALFLAVFVDNCDDHRQRNSDFARFFDVRTVCVLNHLDVFDQLVKRGIIIRRKDHDGDVSYRIPALVIDHLRRDCLPQPDPIKDLSAEEFFEVSERLLTLRENDEINDEDLYERYHELLDANQHLYCAQKIRSYNYRDEDLVLFFVMAHHYIENHDDEVRRGDIDDYFCRSDFRTHYSCLCDGTHPLMRERLVEHACIDGQVEQSAWRLTLYCKSDVLRELKLQIKTNMRANVTHYEDITPKALYYNERVTRQVDQLRTLLSADRMKGVQQRLKDKGMRTGFTCLFYGAPGTGKTETAQQLARETQRDIMLVDVPSIRDKWVGETEKNIRAVFDRYRQACASSDVAPILLFNEADALFCKRAEGATNSVDKMENAMQNIILQELENLDGILIATTNLTGSLDAAFERRFLYKLQFDKPTPAERRHIWNAMLPELSEADALHLADRFDFSGGQIENIARKQLITDVLSERDTLDLAAIEQSCTEELIGRTANSRRVGF